MKILRLLSFLFLCVTAAFSSPFLSAQKLYIQPAVSISDVNLSLPVAVDVNGTGATATGTVTLIGGGYNSGAQNLDRNAEYLFTIPANSLTVGTDTLTVNYSGDTNYSPLSSSVTVKVGASVPLRMSVIGPVATQVAAGAGHTCVLTAQSITQPETIQCWGSNSHGQLGNGTTTDTTVPVQVDNTFYTTKDFNDLEVIALAVGDNHTCALLPDSGQVACWGANASGQLGNGNTADSSTPVLAMNLKIYTRGVALAAGTAHTCALLEDGTAQCWGDNAHGQLGDGSTANSSSPVRVSGLSNAIAIAAGGNHNCALLADGSVVCWGENGNGQLGNGSTKDSATPVVVGGLGGSATLLALGGTHTCALLTDGTLNCWGGNAHGQLGNGSIADSSTPVAVSGLVGATTLAAGRDHTCAVIAAGGGTITCWGSDADGQLGDDSTADKTTPVHTGSLTKVTALTLGGSHSCAQSEIGVLSCWGDNSTGQLGNATKQAGGILSPLPVNGMGGSVATVSAGLGYACSVTAGGTANLGSGGTLTTNGAPFCWGLSTGGDLGDGSTKGSATPVEVAGLTSTVKTIFTGTLATCAVLNDGSADCWGDDVNTVQSSTPVKITGFSGSVLQLSISPYTICALISNGTVQCWGSNYYGGLGDGTSNDSATPVTVLGVKNATAISGRSFHFCALLSDGTAACWGDGKPTPSVVGGLASAKGITAGADFNCALLSDSTVDCWGGNVYGQLGNGTTSTGATGVGPVVGLSGATLLSAGGGHVCALLSDTTVQCWGSGMFGQLGNGTTSNSSIPVKVTGLTGVTTLSAGDEATLALVSDGTLQGWGNNDGLPFGDSEGMSSSNLQQDHYVFPVPVFEGQSVEFDPPQALAVGASIDLAPLTTGSSDLKSLFDTWTIDDCSLTYPVGGSVLSVLSSTQPLLCGVRAVQTGGYNLHGGSLAPAPSQLRSVAVESIVLTPHAALSPSSLAFGSVNVGVTSTAQTLTLSNSGSAALNISSIGITGAGASQFNQTNSCGSTLAAGASCTFSVTFAPTSAASANAAISVADNAAGSPQTAALSGTGTTPGVPKAALTPAVQDFGSITVGASSASQTFTLTNAGTAALPVTSVGLSGPSAASFNITSNTCGSSLAVGASCTIAVSFKPSAAGALSASLAVSDVIGTQTASLTGTGTAPAPKAALTPAVQDFGSITVGASSVAQTFTLTNAGTAALPITSVGISGPSAASFNITSNTCGASLAAGASCTIAVIFKPLSAGLSSASLNVYDILGSQTASLTGTGLVPTLAPAVYDFGSITVGYSSAVQTFSLTNPGIAALSITSAALGGPGATSFQIASNTCGASLAGGASCFIKISFTPSTTGPLSASLTVSDGAGTQTASITGTGLTPAPKAALTPAVQDFGSFTVGFSGAAQTFTLTNAGTAALPITSAGISGTSAASFNIMSNTCGVSLAVAASCKIAIVFRPSVAGPASASLNVSDSLGTQIASLTGMGLAPVPAFTITPSTLNFGNVAVGLSKSLNVTLTNVSSTYALPVMITSSDPAIDTSLFTSYCGVNIPVGGHCTAPISFKPAATKSYSATVTLGVIEAGCTVCTISYPNQAITVTGTGATALPALLIVPSPIHFGSVFVGGESSLTIDIRNVSGTAVSIGKTSASLGFGLDSDCTSKSIAVGEHCYTKIYFDPTIAKAYNGTITFGVVQAGCGPCTINYPDQTIAVAGTGLPAPLALRITPSSIDFGPHIIIGAKVSAFIDIVNVSDTAVSIGTTSVPLGFGFDSNCIGKPIAPAEHCSTYVLFNPTAAKAYNATITLEGIVATACGGCTINYPDQTITVTGAGIPAPPALHIVPSSINFGSVVAGTAALQGIDIVNVSDTAVSIGTTSVPLGFGFEPDCTGKPLAPAEHCFTRVLFNPTAAMAYNAIITLEVETVCPCTISYPSQTITVTGTGFVPPPTLTPFLHDFGNTTLGANSPTQSFTFTNPRSTPLFISESLGGKNAGNFGSPSSFSPTKVEPFSAINIPIFFKPATVGSSFATLYIAYSETLGGPPQTLTAILVGTGIAPPTPTLTPFLQDFGKTTLGTNSPTQYFTFTNPRSTPLYISESLGGTNAGNFESLSSLSPVKVAPFSDINLPIVFRPATVGSSFATLYIAYSDTSGGPSEPLIAILVGTGIGGPAPPVFSPPGGTFASKQFVTISDATPGATIHYTIDGSTPTPFSAVYASPIEVDGTETIRAIAVTGSLSGILTSAVSSASYTITSTACPTIDYSTGFTASGMSLNGGATISGGALELTDGGASEARSAFFSATLPTTSFTTDFTFQITDPVADGMTFTIQSNNAHVVGFSGGGLGYAGIQNSVAIKADLHNNAGEGADSTGIYVDGVYPSIPAINLAPAGIDLHSGHIFAVRLTYSGGVTKGTIKDTVTGVSASMNFPGDISKVVGNNAWFGFTAGTGGQSATQKVLSWSYRGGASCPAK